MCDSSKQQMVVFYYSFFLGLAVGQFEDENSFEVSVFFTTALLNKLAGGEEGK